MWIRLEPRYLLTGNGVPCVETTRFSTHMKGQAWTPTSRDQRGQEVFAVFGTDKTGRLSREELDSPSAQAVEGGHSQAVEGGHRCGNSL